MINAGYVWLGYLVGIFVGIGLGCQFRDWQHRREEEEDRKLFKSLGMKP